MHLNDAGVMVVLADLFEAAMFSTVASHNKHPTSMIVCMFTAWQSCHMLFLIRSRLDNQLSLSETANEA